MAMIGDVGPEGMPASHYASPCRRADRGAGIETVEDDPGLGHLIEVWGLDERMAGKAAISVTMVIRHDEDDMGLFLGKSGKGQYPSQGEHASASTW
jgi:hypothetical protein